MILFVEREILKEQWLACKGFNLRILTGEKIAIVGENGSGKTTLLYLLLGIYRPISGEASVNGKTMELNLDNYRKKQHV